MTEQPERKTPSVIDGTMKAAVIFSFGGPDVFQYLDWPTPVPGDDEILVRNEAVGVGAWDEMWREGTYTHWTPPLPLIIGQISAGRVASLGRNVKGLNVGNPVHVITLSGGTYADYVAVPQRDIIRLPEGIDPAAAACISDYRSAWAFYQDGLQGLDVTTVFIPHATGGIGMAIVQLGKILGYQIAATAGSAEGCKLVAEWGADIAINYRQDDVNEVLLNFTQGRGVDLIFDHVGGEGFARNFDVLADGGMQFILNERGGASDANLMKIMREHPEKGWKIRSWSMHIYDRHHNRREELVEQLVRMLKEGTLRPGPLNRIPLAEASLAHALREKHQLPGKTVLIP